MDPENLAFRLLVFVAVTVFDGNLRLTLRCQLSQIIQRKYDLTQHLQFQQAQHGVAACLTLA